MTESFEEFLKKQVIEADETDVGLRVIWVDALDKWAYKQYKRWQANGDRAVKSNNTTWAYACYERRNAYYEIALACLGRSGLEKRLNAIKERRTIE